MARVTIVLHEKLIKRLRNKQAELLRQSEKSVSFSFVLNQELAKALKVNIND